MIARRRRPHPDPDRTHRGEEEPVPDRPERSGDHELETAWRRIQASLRASVEDSTYELWFAELRPLSARGSALYLTGPPRKLAWVERRYQEILDFALHSSGAPFCQLRLVPEQDLARTPETPRTLASPNPAHTFERFVIGPGNRLAHGAALAVAESPGEAYNPLFLHGAPGLGKTHLLGAIANYLSRHTPDLVVHYATAEAFTNDFLLALRRHGTDAFKERYRRIDVLLIDDVQFLEGKSRTADEFFHTFNVLYDAGSQIVLSADRLPAELSALAERLRQRFQWGLTVDLAATDLATRIHVLRRLATDRGDRIDPAALEVIASRAATNPRQLEGAFTRVLALASLTGSSVGPELVDQALPASSASHRSQPEVTRIQSLVADRLQVEPAALTSPSRQPRASQARHLAMHLTRELTDLSLPAIARAFGRRDHTTVINALRQVRRRLDADVDFQALVGDLTLALDPDREGS